MIIVDIINKNIMDFNPNVSPSEMFKLGVFGGTYWRQITSTVTNKTYQNVHLQYPVEWWEGIPEDHLTRSWDNYDSKINHYQVKVGSTLEEWEAKDWIHELHPYGWVQWYCDYYQNLPGRDTSDDDRQIKRWKGIAGPNGRFKKRLIKMLQESDGKKDSPKIRQTLLHWGCIINEEDWKS